MKNLEKQQDELESQIKLEEAFIKSVKDDLSILIEIESKQTTERNIYQKTEEERIGDLKASLRSKDIRIEETEKEISNKINETQKKLDVISIGSTKLQFLIS